MANLGFEGWEFLGIWDLVIGISAKILIPRGDHRSTSPTSPIPSVFARYRCPRYLMASGRCYWISGPDGAGVAANGVAVHRERSAKEFFCDI